MNNIMRYFRDSDENIYAFDETQMDLVGDKIPLTYEEAFPPKTPEQDQQAISSAIQNMLDTKAQSMRYDNMMSARSYAGYANPFQVEAQSLAVWGANCWAKAGQIDLDVSNGKRPMPTVEEVLSEMPEL